MNSIIISQLLQFQIIYKLSDIFRNKWIYLEIENPFDHKKRGRFSRDFRQLNCNFQVNIKCSG